MNALDVVCVFIVGFCVSGFDAAPEPQRSNVPSKLITTGLECFKDFPVQLDHIRALRSRQFPEDETAKCFINCLYKKMGIIDADGKISEKNVKRTAKQFLKDDNKDETVMKVDELMKKCTYVNDEDTKGKGCERATLATKCFMEHAGEIGLDIPF